MTNCKANIRDFLNQELKIRELPAAWWRKEVRGLLIMDGGILLAALRHVPEARDCPQIGLAHGQCTKVSGEIHPVSAIIYAMEHRMVAMNGCTIYVKSWPSSLWRKLCVDVGISRICYTNGTPSVLAVKKLLMHCVEVCRVTYQD